MASRLEDTIRRFGDRRLALLSKEFLAYLGVSVAALALDAALLYGLTKAGHLGYLTSSTISYSCGAVLHYLLSVRFVFGERRVSSGKVEFAIYSLVGAFGLLVTQMVLKLSVDVLALNVMVGKAAAVGLSFVMNYGLRRVLLFTVFRPAPVKAA